jgi:hypothetical protein
MRDFMVSHADLPRGARLWTFGTPRRADLDGFQAERGEIVSGMGFVTLRPDNGTAILSSPGDQVIRPQSIDRLVLRIEGASPQRVQVSARRDAVSEWTPIAESARADVALDWPDAWRRDDGTVVEQIRIQLAFPPGTRETRLTRVLLYPVATGRASPEMK